MATKLAGSRAGNRYGNDFEVKYLSPAQARFIQRLLNERIHTLEISNVSKINKKHASRIIDQLLNCPKKHDDHISDKQLSYIDLLLKTREGAEITLQSYLDVNKIKSVHNLFKEQGKLVITALNSLPKIDRTIALNVGAYEHDGVVYSVRQAHMTGNLHAYQFNTETKKWEYARGVIYQLKPAERLTLARASQVSALTGSCVHCGRTLTDRKSVIAGMGRICASKYE